MSDEQYFQYPGALEWHKEDDHEGDILKTAKTARALLESDPKTLMMWIDENAETLSKSYHVNKKKMTTLLQMERANG